MSLNSAPIYEPQSLAYLTKQLLRSRRRRSCLPLFNRIINSPVKTRPVMLLPILPVGCYSDRKLQHHPDPRFLGTWHWVGIFLPVSLGNMSVHGTRFRAEGRCFCSWAYLGAGQAVWHAVKDLRTKREDSWSSAHQVRLLRGCYQWEA